MDPSKNPLQERDADRDSLMEELIDGVLLGRDGEDDSFRLEQLIARGPAVSGGEVARRYDERDYQSHRRESFPHPRHQSTRRRTSIQRAEQIAPNNNVELESVVGSPVLSVEEFQYQDLSGSPVKKVQFEIGGDAEPEKKKHHRKHHHHHHHHRDRVVPLGVPEAPGLLIDQFESMDQLDKENLSTHRFSDNKGYRRHKFSTKEVTVALPVVKSPSKYDHQPHEIFVELDVLSGSGEERQWREAARWIKYEEDALEGLDRWGRPHVASLSFHSLINLRRLLEHGVTLLDLEEKDLPGVAYRAVEAMVLQELISSEDKAMLMRALLLKHKHVADSDSSWKFNLRKHHALSESLQSLQAQELEKGQNKGLNTNHTSPDLFGTGPAGVNGKGVTSPPFPRRNSTSSRLFSGDGHEGILIEEGNLGGLHSLSEEEVRWATQKDHLMRRIPVGAEASIVLVGKDDKLKQPIMAFIRLAEGSYMPNITEVPIPVRFIFILLGPSQFDMDYMEIGRSISTLMSNTHFHEIAYKAHDRRDMLKGIHDFLDESIVLPPGDWDNELFPFEEMKEKRLLLRKRKEAEYKRRQHEQGGDKEPPAEEELPTGEEPPPPPDPLQRSHRLFGGMSNDIRRRYRLYVSDILDGFNVQVLASICFIYFACVSGAITFGGFLSEKTGKRVGISETLVSTAAAGMIFSLLSGQPLIIVGTTAPLLLFDESLYDICSRNEIDFLAFRFWIGMWVVVIGTAVVALDGSAIARFFSRFVQEIFSALISVLFIYDALKSMIGVYKKHPVKQAYEENCTLAASGMEIPCPNTALFSTFLTLGTFIIAYTLRGIRTSTYFTEGIRKFLGNFAVPIGIFVMVGVDYGIKELTQTHKLKVPDGLQTTHDRPSWLVDLEGLDTGYIFLAIVPAGLVFILMFMETCICSLIIGKEEMKLRKGTGYHLDIFLICCINGILASIGGCWVCAATVRAVAHATSLIVLSSNLPPGEKPQIIGVKEQRVSNFVISLLVGASVFLSSALALIPMSVLFGVFLYMGISSMSGVQFFERCTLLFKQVRNHPQVPYVQRVKTSKMHFFTLIQLTCLLTLVGIKFTPAAMAIPFLLILLVPLRQFGLKKCFKPLELRALEGTLEKGDESERILERQEETAEEDEKTTTETRTERSSQSSLKERASLLMSPQEEDEEERLKK